MRESELNLRVSRRLGVVGWDGPAARGQSAMQQPGSSEEAKLVRLRSV